MFVNDETSNSGLNYISKSDNKQDWMQILFNMSGYRVLFSEPR